MVGFLGKTLRLALRILLNTLQLLEVGRPFSLGLFLQHYLRTVLKLLHHITFLFDHTLHKTLVFFIFAKLSGSVCKALCWPASHSGWKLNLVIVVIIKVCLTRIELYISSHSIVELFSADLTFCGSRVGRFFRYLQLLFLPDYEFELIVTYTNERLEIKEWKDISYLKIIGSINLTLLSLLHTHP